MLLSAADAADVGTSKALIGCQKFRLPFTPFMVSRIRFHEVLADAE
jgi:hypothetical protein